MNIKTLKPQKQWLTLGCSSCSVLKSHWMSFTLHKADEQRRHHTFWRLSLKGSSIQPSIHPAIYSAIWAAYLMSQCQRRTSRAAWMAKIPLWENPKNSQSSLEIESLCCVLGLPLGLLQAGLWHSSNFIFNQLTCKDYENKIWRWKTSCSPFHFAAMLLFCLGVINPDHPCPLQMGDFTLSCRAVTCVKYPSKRQEF